jgi:hypothetical protein
MSDPQQTVPDPSPTTGGERRRLDRAPGERYGKGGGGAGGGATGGGGATSRGRATSGAGGGPGRPGVIRAFVVADAGALAFFLLGLLDLGAGLVAIAAFIGWVVALALVWTGRDAIPDSRKRMGIAAALGGWSIVAAILADWVYALIQGGVLGPLDYVVQRYGIVALLCVAAAAGVAALRAR